MTHRTLIATALMAVVATVGFVATDRAMAAGPHIPVIKVVGSDATARFVPLGIDKSVVIDLPRDIKDVLVANPAIANAVVRSARRAYIIGVKTGQTNIFFSSSRSRVGDF
jgi:pilus assembly protein CpaC